MMNSAAGFCQSAEFFSESPVHKFPKTDEGVVLKHAFEIRNTGNAPLVISGFDVACHCTKVTLPPPIPPGKTDKVLIEFDTKGKYYQQDRRIILHTNTRKEMETLRFKVYVIPADEKKN